jgi:3-oxoacyl-[acyl-carrier protein] reductase
MRGLTDKIVLVTGAAGGIGRATAERFHDEGSRLLLCDVVPVGATELATRFPQRMTYLQADVSTQAGIDAIERVMAQDGVDVVVNNAGITRDKSIAKLSMDEWDQVITRDKSIAKLSMDEWDQVIAVNLTAVFRLCQAAGRIMKERKRGVILNAASVVAHYGNFGQSNYVASKAGVIGLTKTLARELGRSGIRVNAVAPGFVDTSMARNVPAAALEAIAKSTPLGRMGKPEEIASVYAFLASDDASFITGAVVDVNGGLVLGT